MPKDFSLDTVIGEGWRCGPKLGAFLREVVGGGFHFNAETRDFIHNGAGKTLADAAIRYRESVRPGRTKSKIPEQLEYNRQFREFFRGPSWIFSRRGDLCVVDASQPPQRT